MNIRQVRGKDMEKDEILRMINKLTHEQNQKARDQNTKPSPQQQQITNYKNLPTHKPTPPSNPPLPHQQQPKTQQQQSRPQQQQQSRPKQQEQLKTQQQQSRPQQQQQSRPQQQQQSRPQQQEQQRPQQPRPQQQSRPQQPRQAFSEDSSVIDISDKLELMVDDYLIERKINVMRKLHQPIPQEIALTFDKPWEGNISTYYTIISESPTWLRFYYRAGDIDIPSMRTKKLKTNGQRTCYAESRDGGLSWTKPNIGLFEYEGSRENNIIWIDERSIENFTPFKDTNPNCKPDELYKAVGSRLNPYLLFAMTSPDGINWKFFRQEPLLTLYHGKFDTQNVVFWNNTLKKYMLFFRDCLERRQNIGRGIKIALSEDFTHWTEFKWLKYSDRIPQSEYQLYTNCIQQYFRAPHLLIGLPNRFNLPRQGYPGHPQPGVFDSILMTSRDGFNWNRTAEAIFRPGPQIKCWASRNNLIALNMYQTPSKLEGAPPEISILANEGYYLDKCHLRRYTWRMDGFASINAPFTGGELVTNPLRFTGRLLVLNFSTSAMGWIRVEIQDAHTRKPLSGFSLKDCTEVFGDAVNQMVHWKSREEEQIVREETKQYPDDYDSDDDIDDKDLPTVVTERKVKVVKPGYDISHLQDTPIRLRFKMKDCDLYSFRFLK